MRTTAGTNQQAQYIKNIHKRLIRTQDLHDQLILEQGFEITDTGDIGTERGTPIITRVMIEKRSEAHQKRENLKIQKHLDAMKMSSKRLEEELLNKNSREFYFYNEMNVKLLWRCKCEPVRMRTHP